MQYHRSYYFEGTIVHIHTARNTSMSHLDVWNINDGNLTFDKSIEINEIENDVSHPPIDAVFVRRLQNFSRRLDSRSLYKI